MVTEDGGADLLAQYSDCTIAAGVTVTVPSGGTLRCSGQFTNLGTIVVTPGSPGSYGVSPPATGVALTAAAPGNDNAGLTGAGAASGIGGVGLGESSVFVLEPAISAGGGGATLYPPGARGGGSLRLLVRGPIVNEGTINVDGQDAVRGGGGGGGGLLILASATSIQDQGALLARGGRGGDGDVSNGPGGGGGGGIVHFIAPAILGNFSDVSGGAPGDGVAVTMSLRYGGSGGGGSGDSGGYGGFVPGGASPMPNPASAGSMGRLFETLGDPTALF